MRIQINIGLGIGIIFIFYTKPSHDWIMFNLILAKIISTFMAFPSWPPPFCTNLAKKHPLDEDMQLAHRDERETSLRNRQGELLTLPLKAQWMRNYWRIAEVMPSSLGF